MTIAWNLGYQYNFNDFIIPPLAILWYFLGVLLAQAKRNWFIGIRTPWTLSSDQVWESTHQLGAKLFKISAFISLLGLFFKNMAIYFIIVPVVAAALYLIVYSYFKYQREINSK